MSLLSLHVAVLLNFTFREYSVYLFLYILHAL